MMGDLKLSRRGAAKPTRTHTHDSASPRAQMKIQSFRSLTAVISLWTSFRPITAYVAYKLTYDRNSKLNRTAQRSGIRLRSPMRIRKSLVGPIEQYSGVSVQAAQDDHEFLSLCGAHTPLSSLTTSILSMMYGGLNRWQPYLPSKLYVWVSRSHPTTAHWPRRTAAAVRRHTCSAQPTKHTHKRSLFQ